MSAYGKENRRLIAQADPESMAAFDALIASKNGSQPADYGNGKVAVLPAPSDPMAVARALLDGRYHEATGALTLRHWRGGWTEWEGPAWAELEDRTVRADLYRQVEHAVYVDGDRLKPWAPNRHKMADLLDACAAVAHLPRATQPPTWLNKQLCAESLAALEPLVLKV